MPETSEITEAQATQSPRGPGALAADFEQQQPVPRSTKQQTAQPQALNQGHAPWDLSPNDPPLDLSQEFQANQVDPLDDLANASDAEEAQDYNGGRPRRRKREAAASQDSGGGAGKMLMGLIICGAGIAVTWFSYESAAPGGRYIAFTGAIVWGAIMAIGGFIDMCKS